MRSLAATRFNVCHRSEWRPAHPRRLLVGADSLRSMRNLLIGVGGLVTVLGLLFLLQGTGLIGGSAMSNNHFWIFGGAVVAIIGAAVLTLGVRRPARR